MAKKILISLFIFILSSQGLAQKSAAIDIPLTVSDGSGSTCTLYFGLDPSATDDVDASLGEQPLPPIPPSGIFDARFLLTSEASLRDYRQGTANVSYQKIHQLSYQVGTGNKIVISWNLPATVSGKLNDIVTGTVVDVQMSGTGSYTITNPAAISKLKMTVNYSASGSLAAPALMSPANGAINQNHSLVLNWAASSGAEKYSVQVSKYQNFSTLFIEDTNIVNTSYSLSGLASNTTYYWRVKARNSQFSSGWSSEWSFNTIIVAVNCPLKISDGNNVDTLWFGLDPTATDGLDASLGEDALPPAPPAGIFDCRFNLPVNNDASRRDYRNGSSTYNGSKVHEVQYQLGTGTQIMLTWNLPSRITGRLQDLITGSIIDVPMTGQGSYTVTNPGAISKLKLTVTYQLDVQLPPAPVLLSPSNNSTGQQLSPQLKWNAATGASTYRLQVATDAGFTNLLVNDSTLSGTTYTAGPLNPSTKYYWRVNAKNIAGTGPYSDVWNFMTTVAAPAAPVLLQPTNNAANQSINPTLTWNSVSGASTYRLQVATDSNFTNPIINDSTLSSPLRLIGPLEYNTKYYWRVNAKNAGGAGSYSPIWHFTTFTLVSAAVDLPIYVSDGISDDTLHLGLDPAATDGVDISLGEDALPPMPPSGIFDARMNLPVNNDASKKDYRSGTTTYSGQKIHEVQYQVGTGSQITLSWNLPVKITGRLQDIVTGNVIDVAMTGSGSYTVNNPNALNKLKITLNYQLNLSAPAVPVLVSPANNSSNVALNPQLKWNGSTSAATYHVQVSNDQNFVSILLNDSTLTDTVKQLSGLNVNTTYYWRVRAKNAAGTSNWTSVYRFSTIQPILNLTSPTGGEQWLIGSQHNITWSSSNISNLVIEYSTDNGLNWISIVSSVNANMGTYTWLVPNTPSTHCRLKISDVLNATMFDTSLIFAISNASSFGQPCPGTPSVIYEGKTYNTVQIEAQCWLKENLDVGIMIAGIGNQTNNSVIEKYCYENNEANCTTYGGLYQWNEAMQYVTTPSARGICPVGWHTPNYSELQALSTAVGGNSNALKAIDQGSGSGAGTNTSGFSALLTGFRTNEGLFRNLNLNSNFWSSSEYEVTAAHFMSLDYSNGDIYFHTPHKEYGFSVRCIKDSTFIMGSMQIFSPTGGENWKVGETDTIKWISNGINELKIEYSTNDGSTWLLIRDTISAFYMKYYFAVPNTPSTQCWVRITDAGNSAIGDTSDKPFAIYELNSGQPCPGKDTVVYGGKVYHTVKIGKQCWMRENLNIGISINGTQQQTNNSILEKYCYDNDSVNCELYGGLYQWNEAMQYSMAEGAKGICPAGWHVPTLAELGTMISTAGSNSNNLKAKGQGTGNGAGVNTSGFSALLTGYRDQTGPFININGDAHFWSSVGSGGENTWSIYLDYLDSNMHQSKYWDGQGLSIRCIMDVIKSINLNSPIGGENWQVNSQHSINWTAANVDNIKIEYTTDNGANWQTVISSTPASTGTYNWTVPNTPASSCKIKISDADDLTVNSISPSVFSITTQPLPTISITAPVGGENWLVGTQHNITWTSSNVSGLKIEYSTDNGSAWTSINSLVNAPSGTYSWTVSNTPSTQCKVRLTDTANSTVKSITPGTFTIAAQPVPSISITAPAGGESWQVGTQHNITWTSSNVTGLKIEYSTDNGNVWISVVSSVNASSGTYAWTVPNTISAQCKVKLTDTANSAIASITPGTFTISAQPVPSITITAPVGSENWQVGTQHNITWTSSNVTGLKIDYSTDNGSAWTSIASSVNAATGIYAWTVPNTLSGQCKVRLTDTANSAVNSITSGTFTIAAQPVPSITITAPVGGENWQAVTQHNITWTSSNVSAINIDYSTDNGSVWTSIASSVNAASGTYAWTVPNTVSTQCKVKLTDAANSSVKSITPGTFIISAQTITSITITSPNGGESWRTGSKHSITWASANVSNVKIEFTTNNESSWLTIIASSPAAAGSYEWTVPNTPSTQCKVRISDAANTSLFSKSEVIFTIAKPTLSLTAPIGGETWYEESSHDILWSSSNVDSVKIEYSTNNGSSWLSVVNSRPASPAVYQWYLPKTPSTSCRVKISDLSNPALSDSSHSSFTIATLNPPSVALLSPSGGENWQAGSSHLIKWNSANIANVKIEYSTNNGSSWSTVSSSVAASNWQQQWTVPATLSTQCLVRVSDLISATSSISGSTFSIFDYPPSINIAGTISYSGAINSASYRMVSIPGSVDIPLAQLVSGTRKKDWNAYYDNGAVSNYLVEYDASSLFTFKPGRAFWLLSGSNLAVPSSNVNNLSIDTANLCSIPLDHSGWILIGGPYNKVIDWNKVLTVNNLMVNTTLYSYSNGSYTSVTQMKPYEGYYFYNSTGLTSLKIPYNPNASSMSKESQGTASVNTDDCLNLNICDGSKTVSAISAGLDEKASDDYDISDILAPPAGFEEVSIRLKNEAISIPYKYLRVEKRPLKDAEHIEYNFEVKNISERNVVLKSAGLPIALNKLRACIIDERLKMVYDLDAQTSISIPAGSGKHYYKLVVGTKAFIEELESTMKPAEFRLQQNYPNPFNPVTTIRYQVPQKQRVMIKLYDVLGKELSVIVDQTLDAGIYEVKLDAAGLSSGVYFYKMTAGSFSSVRKFILAK